MALGLGGPGSALDRVSEPGQLPWTVLVDPEGNEFCVFATASS